MSRRFCQFFKILISRVVRGVKGQITVQNDKKFCLSRFISQEQYIIWLSFMVHLCRMIISPGFAFSFYSKFSFFRFFKGIKRQKIVQNNKKFGLSRSICQEPYIIWLPFMRHLSKIIIPPWVYFIFLKFRFLGLFWA